MTHQLFSELAAARPGWQDRYRSLADAARSAGLMSLFLDYLTTPEGEAYKRNILTAHDHGRDNDIRRAILRREIKMKERGDVQSARGYLTEGDAV